VQGRKLNVSLELASHFGKNIRAEKLVLLKVEAEQPILYGHDVLAGSILKISADAGKDELVVLANSSREILALGRLLTDASAIKHFVPTQRVIRNLIDKGWYLRKGG
jgi:ribosome biogenesis protein Nip4